MTDKEVYSYINSIEPCCQLCGSFRKLHRHHINYGNHERDTYIGNIIVLCESCHRMVHEDKQTWQPFLVDLDKQIREVLKMNKKIFTTYNKEGIQYCPFNHEKCKKENCICFRRDKFSEICERVGETFVCVKTEYVFIPYDMKLDSGERGFYCNCGLPVFTYNGNDEINMLEDIPDECPHCGQKLFHYFGSYSEYLEAFKFTDSNGFFPIKEYLL